MNRLLIPLLALMLTACNVGGIPDKVLDIAESRMDTTGYVGRTIPVGAYRSLLVDGFASVRYNAQTTGDARVEVRVHPDYADSLRVEVRDSMLRLGMEGTTSVKLDDAETLKPYYTATVYGPAPRGVTLAGAGRLELGQWQSPAPLTVRLTGAANVEATLVEAPALTLILSGTGRIDLPSVAVGHLDASVSGVGDVRLGGTAQEASFAVSGVGNIDADRLSVAGRVDRQVSGMGRIRADK